MQSTPRARAMATICLTGVTRPVRCDTCVTSISFALGVDFSASSYACRMLASVAGSGMLNFTVLTPRWSRRYSTASSVLS